MYRNQAGDMDEDEDHEAVHELAQIRQAAEFFKPAHTRNPREKLKTAMKEIDSLNFATR